METNNLTFKQQLIYMMAERCVSKYGIQELTDGNIERIKGMADKLSEGTEEERNEKPGIPLDAELWDYGLRLSPLRRNEIDTLGDLLQYSSYDLLKLRNFGRGALLQVEAFLGRHNLKLKDR